MGLKFDMDAHEVQDLKVFNSEGEVIYQADRATIEIHQKVKAEMHLRYGQGYEFEEFGYLCPKCGKLLAYHNGVNFLYGDLSAKFCSECGYKLDYPTEEDLKEVKELYYKTERINAAMKGYF